MDKFNEQYTDYTSTAPSDECRNCGRVDNQWTIKVDNSDKLKPGLRKIVERMEDREEKLSISESDTNRVRVLEICWWRNEIENLLNGGE